VSAHDKLRLLEDADPFLMLLVRHGIWQDIGTFRCSALARELREMFGDRNKLARECADLRDERDTARQQFEDMRDLYNDADNERTALIVALEDARAAAARLTEEPTAHE